MKFVNLSIIISVDAFDFEHLKNLFLTNIDHFKTEHFRSSPSWLDLSRVSAVGSSWRDKFSPECTLSQYPYLKKFIRLNTAGVKLYKFFQTKFNAICKVYQKESLQLPEKSESYFKYLPEINCCELLLLLETDFYLRNRGKYTEIFRKYLFFFGHAISSADPHPVCFIDETLFRCLQFKRTYETFRGDILKIQWETWMMTLVHRRKHSLLKQSTTYQKLDENNLKDVIEYANRIPSIESGAIYYCEPQYRRIKIFSVFDDVVLLIGYSSRQLGNCSSFVYDQIMRSALISREIRTIKFYNAYLGLESRFEMPSNKTDICDFIREVTELHKPGPLYPEKFLVEDLESCFEKLPANALN